MVAVDTDLFKRSGTFKYKPLAGNGFDGPYVKDGKTKYITVNSCPDITRCKGRWCDTIKGNYIMICKVHYLPSTLSDNSSLLHQADT
jgi:hypothetical protein